MPEALENQGCIVRAELFCTGSRAGADGLAPSQQAPSTAPRAAREAQGCWGGEADRSWQRTGWQVQQLSQQAHLPGQDAALCLIQALDSNCICCVLITMVNLVFLFESCVFLLFKIVPAAG